jgi:hypothetical protein
MRLPFRKLAEKDSVPLTEVNAIRAMYISPDLQEVHMTLTAEGGEKVTYQVSVRLTRKLIEELTQAYYAIVPEIRNRRSGIG